MSSRCRGIATQQCGSIRVGFRVHRLEGADELRTAVIPGAVTFRNAPAWPWTSLSSAGGSQIRSRKSVQFAPRGRRTRCSASGPPRSSVTRTCLIGDQYWRRLLLMGSRRCLRCGSCLHRSWGLFIGGFRHRGLGRAIGGRRCVPCLTKQLLSGTASAPILPSTSLSLFGCMYCCC
jgi:hypothetical protein